MDIKSKLQSYDLLHSECPAATYGYTCSPCSENCETQPCDKFTEFGDCPGQRCQPGYVFTGNCTTGSYHHKLIQEYFNYTNSL